MRPAIEVRGVSKAYGTVQALSAIDLDVAHGEFFALLGPNGAGKTTLISLIAGLAKADAGSVRVMGHHVVADYQQARRSLGVVPQELVFDPFFSVRETLRLQSGYYGLRRNDNWIDEILERLDLVPKADANMRSLSGGMKRRVLVAQALVHKPPVIILDEPTAGVDVDLRQGLWEFIRRLNEEGHTIVLTTHYLEEAESLCTRIGMLKQGRMVVLDSTENLLKRFSALKLRLRMVGESLPDSLQPLLAAPGSNGEWVLALRDYAQVEEVLAELRRCHREIAGMELTQPDLEEVFMSIMRGY
ncbi:MAG: ABC transporter ATP-binding protein [Betaproteobacteria bacterium]|jgi:ABC-2 type transport system ATP-binding protein|nr:MAG: ABC transporter ATP-binding protein [Betaproteobacteria bacterium]